THSAANLLLSEGKNFLAASWTSQATEATAIATLLFLSASPRTSEKTGPSRTHIASFSVIASTNFLRTPDHLFPRLELSQTPFHPQARIPPHPKPASQSLVRHPSQLIAIAVRSFSTLTPRTFSS